jgi:hypothetical protein
MFFGGFEIYLPVIFLLLAAGLVMLIDLLASSRPWAVCCWPLFH